MYHFVDSKRNLFNLSPFLYDCSLTEAANKTLENSQPVSSEGSLNADQPQQSVAPESIRNRYVSRVLDGTNPSDSEPLID